MNRCSCLPTGLRLKSVAVLEPGSQSVFLIARSELFRTLLACCMEGREEDFSEALTKRCRPRARRDSSCENSGQDKHARSYSLATHRELRTRDEMEIWKHLKNQVGCRLDAERTLARSLAALFTLSRRRRRRRGVGRMDGEKLAEREKKGKLAIWKSKKWKVLPLHLAAIGELNTTHEEQTIFYLI